MTDREKIANENLQKIAKYVQENLPEGMGFVVLAFEFGMNADENRLLYASNANRDDVIDAMDEFKEKTKEQQYGKHSNLEEKTWYSIEELLAKNVEDDVSIWCLNRVDFSDFLTTMKDLREAVEQAGMDIVKHHQFSIVGKGDRPC